MVGPEKDSGQKPGGHLNVLRLIIVCLLTEDPSYVKEEVEVVKVDGWLLLGQSAETILVDEYVEILYMTQISVENLPIVRSQRLTLCTSPFSYGLKSRSALPRMCIRRTRRYFFRLNAVLSPL